MDRFPSRWDRPPTGGWRGQSIEMRKGSRESDRHMSTSWRNRRTCELSHHRRSHRPWRDSGRRMRLREEGDPISLKANIGTADMPKTQQRKGPSFGKPPAPGDRYRFSMGSSVDIEGKVTELRDRVKKLLRICRRLGPCLMKTFGSIGRVFTLPDGSHPKTFALCC